MRKGIILAGGAGTRLYPLTLAITKQLLPIYDKPMIYYPLSVLMLAGIREILVISTPGHLPVLQALLGDGYQIGMRFTYAEQARPEGVAHAFIVGRQFIGHASVALILGDNLIFGQGLTGLLVQASRRERGATIFGYTVRDPQRYGVIEFDKSNRPVRIVEKPERPLSNWAVPGVYFYDNRVVDFAASLRPSPRGELEITDINNAYLARGELKVLTMGRGIAWLDAGTHEALMQASSFVQALQDRQGLMVACIEEIAYRLGYIGQAELVTLAEGMPCNRYSQYLLTLARGGCPEHEGHDWRPSVP